MSDISRCLEQWVRLTREGLLALQPYDVRARVDAATDLMEQVQRLLDDPLVHPAAPIMLAGAALEELLRSMVDAGPHPVTGKPGLNAYSSALHAAKVLHRQEMKDVTAWAGLRNAAAHGDFEDLDRGRARLMVDGINLFMQRRSPTGARDIHRPPNAGRGCRPLRAVRAMIAHRCHTVRVDFKGGLFKWVRDVGTFLVRRGGSNDVQQLEPVRVGDLLREVPGQWVAIRNGEIIEAKATPDELIAALKNRSIHDATVMRAPTEHEAEFVGIG